MNDKEVAVTVRLPKELRDAFDNACKAEDMTKSQVIRKAITEYLRKRVQPKLL